MSEPTCGLCGLELFDIGAWWCPACDGTVSPDWIDLEWQAAPRPIPNYPPPYDWAMDEGYSDGDA